ncbi:hypothetical protein ANMWB30_37220 [Arthrobacter sp. MWB30]|nr:hypothetical protein ANMWB30_37220 [Arthrobacter sp. MWB30]
MDLLAFTGECLVHGPVPEMFAGCPLGTGTLHTATWSS